MKAGRLEMDRAECERERARSVQKSGEDQAIFSRNTELITETTVCREEFKC